jgi:hypothetical protein
MPRRNAATPPGNRGDNGHVASASAPSDDLESLRLVQRGRRDAQLVLGRAIGIGWPTMRAVFAMRDGDREGQGNCQGDAQLVDPETTRTRFEGCRG